MITAHHEVTIIEGRAFEIAQEYTAITQTILQKSPELALGVFVALCDDLDKASENADDAKLVSYSDIATKIVKMNKDGGEFLHE